MVGGVPRMRIAWAAALCCCTLPVANVQAGEGPALRWKFREGDKLAYAVAQHAVAAVTNSGLDFDVISTQMLDTEWTVEEVEEDGTAQLEMKISRVQMQMSNPFASNFTYDSASGQAGEGPMWALIGPLVEAMLNQPFRAKVSPAGVVSDIQLPETLAAMLAAQSSMAAQNLMMGGSFGEGAYHEMIEWTFLRLPAAAPEGESSWTWEYIAELGNLGTMSTKVEFATPSNRAEVATIDIRHESDFELSDAADAEGFYLEITDQDSSGKATFDVMGGRLREGTLMQKISFEGEIRGNEFFQDRDVTTTIREGACGDLPGEVPQE